MKRNDLIFFILVTGAPISVLGAVLAYQLTQSPPLSTIVGILTFIIWTCIVLLDEVTKRMNNI